MSPQCPKQFAKGPCISVECGGQSDHGCVLLSLLRLLRVEPYAVWILGALSTYPIGRARKGQGGASNNGSSREAGAVEENLIQTALSPSSVPLLLGIPRALQGLGPCHRKRMWAQTPPHPRLAPASESGAWSPALT